jgi:hypothetical protein
MVEEVVVNKVMFFTLQRSNNPIIVQLMNMIFFAF